MKYFCFFLSGFVCQITIVSDESKFYLIYFNYISITDNKYYRFICNCFLTDATKKRDLSGPANLPTNKCKRIINKRNLEKSCKKLSVISPSIAIQNFTNRARTDLGHLMTGTYSLARDVHVRCAYA